MVYVAGQEGGERKAHDSAEQRNRVTQEPWWWKSGGTDTNNARGDKKILINYRSNLNRVISVTHQ